MAHMPSRKAWLLWLVWIVLRTVCGDPSGDQMFMKSQDLLHARNETSYGLKVGLTKTGKGFANEGLCGMPVVKEDADFVAPVGQSPKGQWPWQAMITRFSDKMGYYYFVCAGALIQAEWVMTAAHCFNGEPISHTSVILVDRRDEETDVSTKRFAVSAIICNPDYNRKNGKSDICLVKLAAEVEYNSYIIPVCLPDAGHRTIMGDTCMVTGWDDNEVNAVRATEVAIMGKQECLQLPRKNDTHIESSHFCANYPEESKTCHGESGGPLACERIRDGESHFVLYGVKSVDGECGAKGSPGIFTEVEHFLQWIDEAIAYAPDTDQCFDTSSIHECGSVITASGTILRSPVVDTESWRYPHDLDCSWNIRAPKGYKIQLEFLCFFHVEKVPDSLTKCSDFVTIASEQAGIDILYCGNRLPDPLVLNSNKARIGFHTNAVQSGAGFVIRANFVPARKTSSKRSSGDRPSIREYKEHERQEAWHWKAPKWPSGRQSAAEKNGIATPLLCMVQVVMFYLWL